MISPISWINIIELINAGDLLQQLLGLFKIEGCRVIRNRVNVEVRSLCRKGSNQKRQCCWSDQKVLKQFHTNPLNFLQEAFQQQTEGTERGEWC